MKPVYHIIATLLLLISSIAFAQDALWLDVRTPEEFAQKHVEKAENLPYELVGEKISGYTTDKNAPIYLYCASGRRASIALSTLEEMGYTQVTNLGGLENAIEFFQQDNSANK